MTLPHASGRPETAEPATLGEPLHGVPPDPLPKAETFRDRVVAALERIRPAVQFDGGDVELVEVDEAQGAVRIVMLGACVGCGLSQMTLQHGIERTLKDLVPEVQSVVAV